MSAFTVSFEPVTGYDAALKDAPALIGRPPISSIKQT